MFGLSVAEVLTIMVVALIVLGPQKLPQLAKQLARAMIEMRRVSDDIRSQLEDPQHPVEPPQHVQALAEIADKKQNQP